MFTGRLNRAKFALAFFLQFFISIIVFSVLVVPMMVFIQQQAGIKAQDAAAQSEALHQQVLETINATSTQ